MKRALLGVPALLGSLSGFACRTPSEPEPTPAVATPAAPQAPAPQPPATVATASALSPAALSPAALPPAPRYDVPLRSDDELRAAAAQICTEAQRAQAPLLLDVGADWCGDCRRLYALEREEPLRSALSSWRTLAINLGEERHEWLRQAFGVKAIARWLVVRPKDCSAPLESWPVVASRVVEPKSGKDFRGPAELAAWLDGVRTARD